MAFPVGQVRYRQLDNGAVHVEVLAAEGYPTMCGLWPTPRDGHGPHDIPEHRRWPEIILNLVRREDCDHEGPYRGPRVSGWAD